VWIVLEGSNINFLMRAHYSYYIECETDNILIMKRHSFLIINDYSGSIYLYLIWFTLIQVTTLLPVLPAGLNCSPNWYVLNGVSSSMHLSHHQMTIGAWKLTYYISPLVYFPTYLISRSQCPRGLRHELPSLARTLGSWVQIPLKAWLSVCVYPVFVFLCVSGGFLWLADPPSKESYRMCIGLKTWKSGLGPTKGL
jgi:hypothetical protein